MGSTFPGAGGLQQRPVDVRALREDLVATVPGVHDVQVVHAWSHTGQADDHAPRAYRRRQRRRSHCLPSKPRCASGRVHHATIEIERDALADRHRAC